MGFLLKLFWGKCPAGMIYHLKEGEMSWNHQVHVVGVSERGHLTLIQMGMLRKARKIKKNSFLSRNGTWHSQHRVVVVVGQPANQWVTREGHPQQAKINLITTDNIKKPQLCTVRNNRGKGKNKKEQKHRKKQKAKGKKQKG